MFVSLIIALQVEGGGPSPPLDQTSPTSCGADSAAPSSTASSQTSLSDYGLLTASRFSLCLEWRLLKATARRDASPYLST